MASNGGGGGGASTSAGQLMAIMGDLDTVTGFLLGGIAQKDARGQNFFVVDESTSCSVAKDLFCFLGCVCLLCYYVICHAINCHCLFPLTQ